MDDFYINIKAPSNGRAKTSKTTFQIFCLALSNTVVIFAYNNVINKFYVLAILENSNDITIIVSLYWL